MKSRHLICILALSAGLLIWARPMHAALAPQDARAAVDRGIAWLRTAQNASGVWGDSAGSEFRDTAVVADALWQLGERSDPYFAAVSYLAYGTPSSIDYQARRAVALARGGQDVSAAITALLAAQNGNWTGTGIPNQPEGGWGAAAGYASAVPDTALALDALYAAGLPGGLFVGDETVAAGATDSFHYTLPAGVTTVRVIFSPLAGQIQVRIKAGAPPTLADPYYNLTGPATLGGLSTAAGVYYIRVDGVAANTTYGLAVSYIANGFDTDALRLPLSYLQAAQRADGGWGLAIAADASYAGLTAETVLTLLDYSLYYDVRTALANGLAWLVSNQNGDGGWGNPASTVYETALAFYALDRAGSIAFDRTAAEGWLLGSQSPDGSWNGLPYDTAVAVLALGNQFSGLPAAPASLTISAADPDVILDWALVNTTRAGDSVTVDHYNIYRLSDPYFTVTAATPVYDTAVGLTYPDDGVFGTPPEFWFYGVAAVDGAGKLGDTSQHTGLFEFTIVPGGG